MFVAQPGLSQWLDRHGGGEILFELKPVTARSEKPRCIVTAQILFVVAQARGHHGAQALDVEASGEDAKAHTKGEL